MRDEDGCARDEGVCLYLYEILLLGAFVSVFFLAEKIGGNAGIKKTQHEAIEAGVANWHISDQITGDKEFRWKKCDTNEGAEREPDNL